MIDKDIYDALKPDKVHDSVPVSRPAAWSPTHCILSPGCRLSFRRRLTFIVLSWQFARRCGRLPHPLQLLRVLLFGRTGTL